MNFLHRSLSEKVVEDEAMPFPPLFFIQNNYRNKTFSIFAWLFKNLFSEAGKGKSDQRLERKNKLILNSLTSHLWSLTSKRNVKDGKKKTNRKR
ncbi:MAG: hypothetical protein IPJ74_12635 [Saprospiraceae bacterium]|nr:hypothetical protein [Saprospiraceae bacterium]